MENIKCFHFSSELRREPVKVKLFDWTAVWKSSICSAGFLSQHHVITFWHRSAYVWPTLLAQKKKKKEKEKEKQAPEPATIHLPLSLFIHWGSCLWQKRWQVTGATKINHLLSSTANKCKHLPSQTLTCNSVDAFNRSIRFQPAHKCRIDSFSPVEVTADPVWTW